MSRSRIPKALCAKVAAQARYRCGYCLTAESIIGTSMELGSPHPGVLGGLTGEDNLWLACSLCNDSKGCRIAAEDPSTGEVVRLFNPRHQDWHEHFSWSQSGSVITGRTQLVAPLWPVSSISTAPHRFDRAQAVRPDRPLPPDARRPAGGLARLSEGLRLDPDDAELHFRKAVLHRKAGQPAEAEACWRRILTLSVPTSFAASIRASTAT